MTVYNTYMTTKTCKKCGLSKGLDRFEIITRNAKTYHIGTCRDCVNARKRKGTGKRLFNDGISKECGSCGKIKPHSEFSKKSSYSTGVSSRCRECHNAWYKEYYAENAEAVKRNTRKWRAANETQWSRHGLTLEQFVELRDKFDGKCWICKLREGNSIDHDHNHCPGKVGCQACVRGLLCSHCNAMLGQAKDNVETLQSAIEYLTGSIGAVL